RNITLSTPAEETYSVRTTVQDKPGACRRSEDRNVGSSIAVKITRMVFRCPRFTVDKVINCHHVNAIDAVRICRAEGGIAENQLHARDACAVIVRNALEG